MQTQNDRTVDALMEQLIESGLDGLAAAFVAMLNRAMRMERERANGALAYERSAARTAYANGYKPKKIDTPAGTLTVQVPKSRGGETPFYPRRSNAVGAPAAPSCSPSPRCTSRGQEVSHPE